MHSLSRGARGDLQQILSAGRALVLLDGLDEVRDTDNSRVLWQIREFSQQFHQNQFVITCRIAAREYTFEQFTEVEIADFDDKQIADFSGKWFRCKNDPIKANRFLSAKAKRRRTHQGTGNQSTITNAVVFGV
jgi:predicted NACHT family NTPase